MKALAKDPRFKFTEGDKGRAEIMAYIQERIANDPRRAAARLQHAGARPSRGPAHVARAGARRARRLWRRRLDRRQDPGQVLDQPAHHRPAQQVQPARPRLHEAIPGHVWQGEYANKLPLIRSLLAFNAYSEGWALYAEQLADELGVYDDYPVGAPRLPAVDRLPLLPAGGRHRPPRQALDAPAGRRLLRQRQRLEPARSRERSRPLLPWPGQACGYKVGHSEIDRLRDKAKAELGPKYDLRAFDDAVVLGGNVPMDVLAKNVDEYIARTKAA